MKYILLLPWSEELNIAKSEIHAMAKNFMVQVHDERNKENAEENQVTKTYSGLGKWNYICCDPCHE